MNVVTSADKGFYHCLKELVQSVNKHYGKPPIVYDLGLTEEQKESLNATIIPIKIQTDFQGYASYTGGDGIKATHKPFCVKHYFENHDEKMIFLDADCLFTQRVELDGFDVAITLKTDVKRLDLNEPYAGILNSGVIFFNNPATELVDAWLKLCAEDDNTTDQKSLVDILSEVIDWKHENKIYDWHGLKIKVLGTYYNDHHFRKGCIYHFKTNKHSGDLYPKLIEAYHQGKNLRKVLRKHRKELKAAE
ncbi:MAG: hypothetical protein DRP56_03900 [Planctomycetota bacterium]|nr:MAG: hypothetical protein DRP56_03900 [Planctomycetota bacterium]